VRAQVAAGLDSETAEAAYQSRYQD
jgi:hypothetical protein